MAHPDEQVDGVEVTGLTVEQTDSPQPEQPDDELTYPFKGWLEAAPGRPVVAAGISLVVLQLIVRSWSKFGGWFTSDDFSFMSRAFTMPFWSSEYLLAGWHGHFMPGAFVQVKILATLWPYNYVPVAMVDIALQAAVSMLMLRLLISLFGARVEILIPLAFFVFTPMTLPAFLWWAAALNQLWGLLAMVLMLLAQLRYHRTGRLRDGLLGVAAMAFGLLFSEKLLLMAPVVAAFTLLWFTPGPPLRRIRRAIVENWRLWAAYGTLIVLYAVTYRLLVVAPLSQGDTGEIVVETVGRGLFTAVIPAVFGGPYVWAGLNLGGFAATPLPVTVILLVVTALVVWLSIWLNARASFAWWVMVGYAVINTGILGATRATFIGSLMGAEYRYQTDLAVIIAVFAPMAFLPLQGTFRKGTYQALRARHRERFTQHLGPGVVGGIVVALSLSALVSTVTYDPLWRKNTRDTYFANIGASIAAVDHPITMIDFPVEFVGYSESSKLFSAFQPRPHFLTKGASADIVFVPDDNGVLRRGKVNGFVSTPGPEEGCGWRLADAPVTVPLTATTMPWVWTAQMSYLATYDNDVTVTAGKTTTTLHLKAGANTVFFVAEGEVSRIDFGPVPIGTVCTDAITVGGLQPTPDTTVASTYGVVN
ncbi:MAG: hypothetical protein KBB39_14640 [Phycicoccus sp.]|nr:hypothetical protein [Phycicoccus sp.]